MADNSDWQLQNSLQAIEFSRECIRMAVLMNGGAAVALLGLVGGSERVIIFDDLRYALQLFSGGLFMAFLTAFFGYFAQTAFTRNNGRVAEGHPSDETLAVSFTVCGAITLLISIGLFCFGVYTSGFAIFPSPVTLTPSN